MRRDEGNVVPEAFIRVVHPQNLTGTGGNISLLEMETQRHKVYTAERGQRCGSIEGHIIGRCHKCPKRQPHSCLNPDIRIRGTVHRVCDKQSEWHFHGETENLKCMSCFSFPFFILCVDCAYACVLMHVCARCVHMCIVMHVCVVVHVCAWHMHMCI